MLNVPKKRNSTNIFYVLFKLIFPCFLAFASTCSQARQDSEFPVPLSIVVAEDTVNVDSDGKVFGTLVNNINCISRQLGFDYSLVKPSLMRGIFLFKKGHVDILASVNKTSIRDQFGEFLYTFFDEPFVAAFAKASHRNTVFPTDSESMFNMIKKRGYYVSVLAGSAEYWELKENGIDSLIIAKNTEEVVNLVSTGIADTFVIGLGEIEMYEKKHNVQFTKIHLFSLPRGYYVSNELLNAHPGLKKRFIDAASMCSRKYGINF